MGSVGISEIAGSTAAGDFALGQDELSTFTFSERDGIFLTDEAQLDYLCSNANPSLEKCWMLPLSVQAYAAALRKPSRIQSYFDFVDFPQCKRQYNVEAQTLSRSWLKELGLGFEVQGIDLATFDAPCQFLLFNLAAYLEQTAARLIHSRPDLETFYVVSRKDPLPLDFYFDSDVQAAMLRFTCEQLGRRVRQIVLAPGTWVFPFFAERPITSNIDETAGSSAATLLPHSGPRVGFAPSTSPNYQQILEGLRAIGSQTVLFRSTWGMPLVCSGQANLEYQLTDGKMEGSPDWDQQLAALWTAVRDRRHLSTLPRNIIANPYMDFQLAYIFMRRWSSYLHMLDRAKDLVRRMPLDLFIHSETFTAEGAILASCYRRAGTPILIAPHSRWPCDRNWSTCQPSDGAVAFSNSAARRLSRVTGTTKVYVTTPPSPPGRSLLRTRSESDLVKRRKSLAAGRMIAVVVTNALELLSVPFTDLGAHFRTMSVLAIPPESLRNRVMIALRTKPRPLGEDPALYRSLCGFPEESLTFLEGLTFSQCLELADCAIGVNVPTTGYFEIMEKGVPLLHIQHADAVTFHPDLPGRVTAEVRSPEAIWPAIERVLFDTPYRQRLLKRQQQFLNSDKATPHSVENILLRMTAKRSSSFWPWKQKPQPVSFTGGPSPQNVDLQHARIAEPHAGDGYLDDLFALTNGAAAVAGWAADFLINRPARLVHILADGQHIASGSPNLARPDVAQLFGRDGIRDSGFLIRIPLHDWLLASSLQAYAELNDGSLIRLKLSQPLT